MKALHQEGFELVWMSTVPFGTSGVTQRRPWCLAGTLVVSDLFTAVSSHPRGSEIVLGVGGSVEGPEPEGLQFAC
jgi:hypothetical protein